MIADLTKQLRRDEGVLLTPEQAKCAGRTTYFTGKPCKYGHLSPRWVSTRTCTKCSIDRYKAWSKNNVEKASARKRRWYEANAEKQRHTVVKRKYGLSDCDYKKMMSDQSGLCAICDRSLDGKWISQVDHCHATGKIRGLLCLNCNSGIGRFGDNTDLLRKAILYLERSR